MSFKNQDAFLQDLQKNKTKITIFLMNGKPINGIIQSFDNFVVFVKSNNKVSMVYKHAISTIQPA
ncbi:MAG: RNA chaperone Hfq [bacterium]